MWSTTRREIAATFGYAQPDHTFRVAVFEWPSCEQVGAISWVGGHRALCAVAYPSPAAELRTWVPQGFRNGCIAVATSDQSIKFHELWDSPLRSAVGGAGMLAGSDVLESLEGIHKEGDIIR